MGNEQSWGRQHVYVPIACLILIVLGGCITIQRLPPVAQEYAHLESIEAYFRRGDFDGAMKASQAVLSRSPKTHPGDEALINLGLISAHYANPKKDYKKALGYFQRVEREFPESLFLEEAKIWIGVLQSFEKSKLVDIEIEEMKKGIGK